METQISEEDLLSGIEVLPTTQPGTPSNYVIKDVSVSSVLDDSISPLKKSPVKNVSSKTITASHEVQKRLHDSLASSLRKEVEMKSTWQSSPGEVKPSHILSHKYGHGGTKPTVTDSLNTVAGIAPKQFLTLSKMSYTSSDDNKHQHGYLESGLATSQGPNLCLASEFQSSLSPIKYPDGSGESPTKEVSSQHSKELGDSSLDDSHTKKLLTFMQQLEKNRKTDQTSAQQLHELSTLLKNSSVDSKHSPTKMPSESQLTRREILKSWSNSENKKISDQTDVKRKVDIMEPKVKKTNNTNRQLLGKLTAKSNRPLKKDASADKRLIFPQGKSGEDGRKTGAAKMVQFSSRSEASKRGTKQRSEKSKIKNPHSADDRLQQRSVVSSKHDSNGDQVDEEPSRAVSDMISVRDHLHTMLNLHKIDPTALDSSGPDLYNSTEDCKDEDTFRSTDTATLLRTQPSDLMPPVSPLKDTTEQLTENLASDLVSILKSGNSQHSDSAVLSSVDSSLTTENGILRDTLEKERYRRKHCEKQIQKLQKKMLDIQQELAVANSTERKKDLMIEQLDKTLAKVVEGWKEHEQNMGARIMELSSAKEKYKEDTVNLKEMIVNLENELAKVLEELVEEKERLVKAEENENLMHKNYQARTEEISQVIDQKNENMNRMREQNDELRKKNSHLNEAIEELKESTEEQKKSFIKKEEEWEEVVIEMEKKHRQEIDNEKNSSEKERKRSSEIQDTLTTTLQETRRLEELLEAQRNELESMRTRAALTETKHTASIRKMEAEHKIDVERQVTEKLTRFHEEAQKNENAIRESHKKQVLEFIEGHKREIEGQCQRYEDELQKRDQNMKRLMEEKEKAFEDKLKAKNESMRQLMLSKMQNLLQAHYNETLQIVGTTTGETPQRQRANLSLVQDPSHDPSRVFDALIGTSDLQLDMLHSMRQSQLVPAPASYPPHKDTATSAIGSFPPATFPASSNVAHTTSSSFQPYVAASAVDRAFVPLRTQPGSNLAVLNHEEIEEDALPNLSLISSISHSTVASLQQKEFLSHELSKFNSLPGTTGDNAISNAHAVASSRLTALQASSYPIQAVAESNKQGFVDVEESMNGSDGVRSVANAVENRDKQLQYYINMLLERAPGDPLDTSRLSESRNNTVVAKKSNESEVITNSFALEPPSPALMQILHQRAQVSASPDLVPVKQSITSERADAALNRSSASSKAKGNPAKRPKQGVRFAQQLVKFDTIQPVLVPTAEAPPAAAGVFNPDQMGEISRMLGLYTKTDTPTGETKLAAEQLLEYLRSKQTPLDVKTSVQPSVASSPLGPKKLKQTVASREQAVASQLVSSASGGKVRIKSSTVAGSPVKPCPAWR